MLMSKAQDTPTLSNVDENNTKPQEEKEPEQIPKVKRLPREKNPGKMSISKLHNMGFNPKK